MGRSEIIILTETDRMVLKLFCHLLNFIHIEFYPNWQNSFLLLLFQSNKVALHNVILFFLYLILDIFYCKSGSWNTTYFNVYYLFLFSSLIFNVGFFMSSVKEYGCIRFLSFLYDLTHRFLEVLDACWKVCFWHLLKELWNVFYFSCELTDFFLLFY